MGHYIGEVDDSDVTFSSPDDLGGQNWNELPRLIRGHGTVDPKEPVNHSLNATPHGWLGPSNTCCVGAIRRSVPPLSSLTGLLKFSGITEIRKPLTMNKNHSAECCNVQSVWKGRVH